VVRDACGVSSSRNSSISVRPRGTRPAPPVDDDERPSDALDGPRSIGCDACAAALESPNREPISFLLFDRFTTPLVGCPDHLKRFGAVCGLTTEDSATLLEHRPAGGVPCPGCRQASHRPQHPVLPVRDGAVAVLTCRPHQADIVGRVRAGLQAQHDLTSTLTTL